jgi:hypothetical protein
VLLDSPQFGPAGRQAYDFLGVLLWRTLEKWVTKRRHTSPDNAEQNRFITRAKASFTRLLYIRFWSPLGTENSLNADFVFVLPDEVKLGRAI